MAEVILGFSGGVDSSVSAVLLRRAGYSVRGVFLDTGGAVSPEDVRAAAGEIGIPLDVIDVREDMENLVCRPFYDGYMLGRTPNPCVLCNREVKFRKLCEYADAAGAGYIATGHYVRAENGVLSRGRDPNDQSYMLCRITAGQAKRLIAPLGNFDKSEVRAMAGEFGIRSVDKPASMEICFIPGGDYAAWMEERGGTPPPGNFIYRGEIVGRHRGIHRYTLGQRRRLDVKVGRRVYVSEIRRDTNEIVLSDGDDVYAESLTAVSMNWLAEKPEGSVRCEARIRHSKGLFPAVLTVCGEDGIRLDFEQAVRAPTAGQAAAVYSGERLLGGGFIV